MRLCILSTVFVVVLSAQPLTNDRCADDNEHLPCCFLNAPKHPSSIIAIAGNDEPGERLIVNGRVVLADGKTPATGVTLYAYHTNRSGIYPKRGNEKGIHVWHGYLHGWGRTGKDGVFEIRTIRPAQYPTNDTPAHIHIVVKEPSGRIYYTDDIMFADDPLVKRTDEPGVIRVAKNSSGVWAGERIIRLKR